MATETARLLKNIAACHVEADTSPTACRGESWNVMPAARPDQPASELAERVNDPPA